MPNSTPTCTWKPLRLRRQRQGRGAWHRPARARVESDDPTALIGLPLIALTGMLRAAGYPFFGA